MFARRNPVPLFASLCLLLFTASASCQVLVYTLHFQKERGVNYHFYESGYFVVPLLGGEGTFILTTTEDGRRYTVAPGAGRLFTAVTKGKSQSVLSATTGGGTAEGAIVAMGDIDKTVRVNNPLVKLTAQVAASLNGYAISADDESEVEEIAIDGTLGSAGFSQVKLQLDDEETRRMNQRAYTIAQATEQLELQLQRKGYAAVETDDGGGGEPDPDDGEVKLSTATAEQP